MPGTEYPGGTFPAQQTQGVNPPTIQPNPGGPQNVFTGGTVFAGGILQSVPKPLFDSVLGVLNWPYQGIRSGYSAAGPVALNEGGSGFGVTKALAGGTFASMVAGKYIMLTFTSQIAGVTSTLLQSPGSWNRKSQNVATGWINTVLINRNGGFYMSNGLPVNAVLSRDNMKTETYPGTYAIPGRLTFLSSGKLATVENYQPKSD